MSKWIDERAWTMSVYICYALGVRTPAGTAPEICQSFSELPDRLHTGG